MSVVISALHELSAYTTASDPGMVVAADDGMISWVNGKLTEVQSLIRLAVGVGAAAFVGIVTFGGGFKFVKLLSSGAVAALLVWIVWNVTEVKDRVDKEWEDTGEVSSLASAAAQQPFGGLPGVSPLPDSSAEHAA